MSLLVVWSVVLVGFLLCRVAELRIHTRNYEILRAAGAEERGRPLVRHYYALQLLVAPLAIVEQLALHAPVTREAVIVGLLAMLVAVGLRFWAISSLGTFWTMRCLGLPGVRHANFGPYRYLNNPEYLSRFVEGCGLCVLFGARAGLVVFAVLTLALGYRLARIERVQASEMSVLPLACAERSRSARLA